MTATPLPAPFDVVVVGAGPAGAATARRLARRGVRVALLERSGFDGPRIGESLAPDVADALSALGLWESFLGLRPLPSYGTKSVWGSSAVASHSHLRHPNGCGWHVNRTAFDGMLAEEAERAGASLFVGVELKSPTWNRDGWELDLAGGISAPSRIRGRLLVDATGRRCAIARALGARPLRFDRLVGIGARFEAIEARGRRHLFVEATADGWWYSAPLPRVGGVAARMVMLMTDADLCAKHRWSEPARWLERLAAAHETLALGARGRRLGEPRTCCAHSHRLQRDLQGCGTAWLAVGDSALAVDPVSGSGVPRALRGAIRAADCAQEMLSCWEDRVKSLDAYEDELDRNCTQYLEERAHYYDAERRFDTPFWRRRHVLPLAVSP